MSIKEPLLSFVIPAYNCETCISHLLDSIFSAPISQDSIEVIVVDDCSVDGTRVKVREYQKVINHLILCNSLKNSGPASGRNQGLDLARGRYIWFVDADDTIETTELPNLLSYLSDSTVDMVVFNFLMRDAMHTFRYEMFEVQETSITSGVNLYCSTRIYPSPWNKIVRRQFLLDHRLRFEVGVYPEDEPWCIMCFLNAEEVCVYERYLYVWHVTPGSLSKDSRRYCEGYPRAIKKCLSHTARNKECMFWQRAIALMLNRYDIYLARGKQNGEMSVTEVKQARSVQRSLAIEALQKTSPGWNLYYFALLSIAIHPGIIPQAKRLISRCKQFLKK